MSNDFVTSEAGGMLSREEHRAITAATPCAPGLPNRAYTADAFLAWEREHVFARTWTCIGNACTVPAAGDVAPVNFLDTPLLMVRNKRAELRVFHNVCSHRGNELVWQACHTPGRIRCPYHAWSYDLDGALQGTPHVGGMGVHDADGFCRENHGLRAVRSTVWMDLVFVDLSDHAPEFADFIAPLQARLDRLASPAQFAELEPAATHGTLTVEFAGNWKLDIENNLEAYHLPWVHPDLNSISRLEDHYDYYGGDLFAGQGSRAYDHRRGIERPFPAFEGWPQGVSEYPSLYPNVFLGLHCDHVWTRIVQPVSPSVTLDHTQLYYLGEGADGEAWEAGRVARLQAWSKVFGEDIGVVAGMQRGRRSAAFEGGVFTPVMDAPSRHFARWMAERYNQASFPAAVPDREPRALSTG